MLLLDGNDSYFDLPPDILSGLDEATIEGWVRWDEFRSYSRFFSFGEGYHRLCVYNFEEGSFLQCAMDLGRKDSEYISEKIRPRAALTAGRWVHVAVVLTKEGTSLYLDGTLAGSEPKAHLSLLKRNSENRLGASGSRLDGLYPLHGAMDEVRVWKVARTP